MKEVFDTVLDGTTQIQTNSKLINSMVRHQSLVGKVKVFPNDKDTSKSLVTTSIQPRDINNLSVNDIRFTAEDKLIFDAVLTFLLRNVKSFTPQDVIRLYSGNNSVRFSEVRVKNVYNRLMKMANTSIVLDCANEFKVRGIRFTKDVKLNKEGTHILPISPCDIILKNKTVVSGYRFTGEQNDNSLISYILSTSQLIAIPSLHYGSLEVQDSNEYDIIQMYCLQRISNMKHDKRMKRIIRFDSFDKKNPYHGLYNYIGLSKEQYEGNGWINKQNKVIKQVTDVLNHQVKEKNIKSYNFVCKKGFRIPNAVEIILK